MVSVWGCGCGGVYQVVGTAGLHLNLCSPVSNSAYNSFMDVLNADYCLYIQAALSINNSIRGELFSYTLFFINVHIPSSPYYLITTSLLST